MRTQPHRPRNVRPKAAHTSRVRSTGWWMWRPKVDTRRDPTDGAESDRGPSDGPVLKPRPRPVTGTFAGLCPNLGRVDTAERHAEPATCADNVCPADDHVQGSLWLPAATEEATLLLRPMDEPIGLAAALCFAEHARACSGSRSTWYQDTAGRDAVARFQFSSAKYARFSSLRRIRQPAITRSRMLRNRSLWPRSIRWTIS